jgi:predicted aspartyl protease
MAKALAKPAGVAPALGELPLETRKLIYQQLKQAKASIAEMEKLAADDPALAEVFAAAKAQQPLIMEQAMASMNINRAQLDAIMAEGDKEMW